MAELLALLRLSTIILTTITFTEYIIYLYKIILLRRYKNEVFM